MIDYTDEEEKEIIENIHNEEWISVFNENLKNEYTEIAINTIERTKNITIKISEKDFQKLRGKAYSAGINYQSIVNALIHQYNEGNISLMM